MCEWKWSVAEYWSKVSAFYALELIFIKYLNTQYWYEFQNGGIYIMNYSTLKNIWNS